MSKNKHESYLSYLDNFKHNHLTLEDMHRIHLYMLEDTEGDSSCPMTKDLYKSIVDASIKYTNMRLNPVKDMSEYERAESILIHRFYNFLGHIKRVNPTPKWEEDLVHPLDGQFDRERVYDFACYLAFVKALNTRS